MFRNISNPAAMLSIAAFLLLPAVGYCEAPETEKPATVELEESIGIDAPIVKVPSKLSLNAAQTDPFVCLNPTEGDPKSKPSKFYWDVENFRYEFDASGKVVRTTKSTNESVQNMALSVSKEDHITQIKVKPYQNDLLIAFETSDGSSGTGQICRFSVEPFANKWCLGIYGFNVIASLGADGAAYVGSYGFVGRVNLDAGKYFWKLSEVFDKDMAGNIFEIPVEDESAAVFAAARAEFIEKEITINKLTGETLGIREFKSDSPERRKYQSSCDIKQANAVLNGASH